ncbi:MAG TPA: hypothetical protein VJZ49_15355 [Syntrophales bacterium]|nr:hypothetical protein [Syntrophales bacterium]
MTDTIVGALIGVGSAILGAIVGAWIGYRLSISLVHVTTRHNAASNLRKAFYDELAILNMSSLKDIDACSMLEGAFKKHMIAFWELKSTLPKSKCVAFTQAWEEYYCYPGTGDHHLEQYDTLTGGSEQRKGKRTLAIKRIEHILSFTE